MSEQATENKKTVFIFCVGWFFAAFGVFLLYFATGFESLGPANDGCTYAACARNIARGDGAIAQWAPVILYSSVTPGNPVEPIQKMGGKAYALWPLVLALFFLLFGATDATVALAGGVVFALGAPFIFLAGKNVFSNRAGHLAAALYVFNAALLGFSVAGLTENLFITLIIAAIYFASKNSSLYQAGLFGVFAYLICFTKTTGLLWALPLGLLLLTQKKGRARRLAVAALAFGATAMLMGAVISGALDRPQKIETRRRIQAETTLSENAILPAENNKAQSKTQKPKALLSKIFDGPLRTIMLVHSASFPEHSYARGLTRPVVSEEVQQNAGDYWMRAWWNIQLIAKGWFWNMTNPLVVILFWFGVVVFLQTKGARLFVIAALCSMICGAFPHVVTFAWLRYLQPAIPFYLLLAAAVADRFSARIPHSKGAQSVLVLLVLACSFPFGFTAGIDSLIKVSDQNCLMIRNGDSEFFATLSSLIRTTAKPDETVVYDPPSHAAWYGDRQTVWLPNDMRTLRELKSRVNLDYVFLNFSYTAQGKENYWKDLLKRHAADPTVINGMTFIQGVPTKRGTILSFATGIKYKGKNDSESTP